MDLHKNANFVLIRYSKMYRHKNYCCEGRSFYFTHSPLEAGGIVHHAGPHREALGRHEQAERDGWEPYCGFPGRQWAVQGKQAKQT